MTEDKILHSSIEHLHGPEEVAYAKDELVVVCLVRDGQPYVKSFVEHHFALGVKHIFFLDNGSTDGTVEALKNYENVTVLRSKLPFTKYEFLVGRTGTALDDAMAESFIATLKTELVHRRRHSDREAARSAIFEYLEGFYKTR